MLMFTYLSLNIMKLRNCHLEVSYTDSVVDGLPNLFCTIVHSVKFTNFVVVTDGCEHLSDFVSSSELAEVLFLNSNFRVV